MYYTELTSYEDERRRVSVALSRYFTGEISNYEFDSMRFYPNDYLCYNILNTMYLIYDDTFEHLWFRFYNNWIHKLISIWFFLLNSKNDGIPNCLQYKESMSKLKEYWETCYYYINFNNCKKSISFLPIVSTNLIQKDLCISSNLIPNKYIWIRDYFYIKRVIISRDVVCRAHYMNTSIIKMIENEYDVTIDKELFYKSFPGDSLLFFISWKSFFKKFKQCSTTLSQSISQCICKSSRANCK